MNSREHIETEAARWVARSGEQAWGEADEVALQSWLAESIDHRVAWLRLRSVWQRADRLAALRHVPIDVEPPRAARVRRLNWLPWCAAAAVCLLAIGLVFNHVNSARETYRTEIGGRQSVPLADGSRVELNTQTRLRAAIDERQREVWLEEGEAYFEVERDPSRPFVVHAGERSVTVLGTKFSVLREGARFEVVVLEGQVRVDDERKTQQAKPILLSRGGIVLAQQDARATLIVDDSAARAERELSWRQGVLSFEQTPLAEAAAEFNRYHRRQLVIVDRSVAEIRIGGSFDAAGLDAFVRLLQRGFGLRVEEQAERILISRG
ncbi:FecR family protein [Steroidobacter sp.]|uniref:FecR family protein n=1 Tax=Steroidobacter sp. TaxID=1978227 RepID=UPI001A3A56B2|nr:FecR domain-containing protein [Steroidobacter sp.]MBL8271626.1 FecR domain-containing protein [Steroidobacter sp.]